MVFFLAFSAPRLGPAVTRGFFYGLALLSPFGRIEDMEDKVYSLRFVFSLLHIDTVISSHHRHPVNVHVGL